MSGLPAASLAYPVLWALVLVALGAAGWWATRRGGR